MIQAENHRLRPASTLVHPSATSISGFAPVCCRNKFLLLCQRVKKDVQQPDLDSKVTFSMHQFSLGYPQAPSQPRLRAQPRISSENQSIAASSPIRKANGCARNTRRMREVWWVTGSGRGHCIPNPALHFGSPDLPLPSFPFCQQLAAMTCPRQGTASALKSGFIPQALLLGQFSKRVRPAVHTAVLAADYIRSPHCRLQSQPFIFPFVSEALP